MRPLVFLLVAALSTIPAIADETAVGAALDQVISLALDDEDEALAARLACFTGSPGPGTLHLRPCVPSADGGRVAAIAEHLRAVYAAEPPYVLDWLKPVDGDGFLGFSTQVKIRTGGSVTFDEYRFVEHAGDLLLADAGPVRLTIPELPPPASPREDIERAMQQLFHLAAADDTAAAAALVACPSADQKSIHRCDPAVAADLARVDGMLLDLAGFVRRLGPASWAFTGYRTAEKSEGLWHLLEIGYLDEGAPGGSATAIAAFIQSGDGLALGDLVEWPD